MSGIPASGMRRHLCAAFAICVLVALTKTVTDARSTTSAFTNSRSLGAQMAGRLPQSIVGIFEEPHRNGARWVIQFSGLKPVHRVTRSSNIVRVLFSGSSCPMGSAIRTSSLAAAYSTNAAFEACRQAGRETTLIFHVDGRVHVVLAPTADSLVLTTFLRSTAKRQHVTPHRTTLDMAFFEKDVIQRTNKMSTPRLEQLEDMVAKNPRSASAHQAATELATMEPSQRPIILANNLSSNRQERIQVLGRGSDEMVGPVFTRLYTYLFDARTGGLISSENEIASDALAQKFGLPTNNLRALEHGGH